MNQTPRLGGVVLAMMLATCGSSTSDRALSGAGIGAGAGAAGATVTGGSTVGGAAVGAAAGSALDTLISPRGLVNPGAS